MSTPFRTAVAMNNIGVSLLQKRCFDQGLQTLQDALYLMQEAIENEDLEMGTCPESLRLLTLASQRLAKPKPSKESEVIIEVAGNCEYMIHLPKKAVGCTILILPIRLEYINVDIHGYLEYHCAKILYNLALAHMCLASNQTDANDHLTQFRYNEKKKTSIKVLRMSCHLFANVLSANDDSSHSDVFGYYALALKSLIRLLEQSGAFDEAAAYRLDLGPAVNSVLRQNRLVATEAYPAAAA